MPLHRLFVLAVLLALPACAGVLFGDDYDQGPIQLAKALGRIVESPTSNEEEVYNACDALKKLGPSAAVAAPALGRALQLDEPLRTHAADALIAIGPGAIPALRTAMTTGDKEAVITTAAIAWATIESNQLNQGVPIRELLHRLAQRDPTERCEATVALLRIACAPLSTQTQDRLVPSKYYLTWARLEEFLVQAETGRHDQRLAALAELAEDELSIAEVARRVRKLLDDPVADIARAASATLATMGDVAIPQFLDAMKSRNGNTRLLAVRAFANRKMIGAQNREPLVQAVGHVLDDPDPVLRRAGVETLFALLPQSEPVLIGAMKGDDAVKLEAVEQFIATEGGDFPQAVVHILAQKLVARDPRIRQAAAATLYAIWPESEPVLTLAMKGGDDAVRTGVVEQLLERAGKRISNSAVNLHPDVTLTVDETYAGFEAQVSGELLRRMNSKDPVEAERAFEAMRALRSSKVRDQLVAALLSRMEDKAFRADRGETARKVALMGTEFVPAWLAGAKSKDDYTREWSYAVLADPGQSRTDGRIIAAMTAACSDPDTFVRSKAIKWARYFTQPPPGVAEKLAGCLTPANALYDNDLVDRYHVIELLGKWRVEPGTSVPALAAALSDDNLQWVAVLALQEFGADARPAAPQLAALLKTDRFVFCELFQETVNTLVQLGPEAQAGAVGYLSDTLRLVGDPQARLWAVRGLATAGSQAAAAAPILTAMLAESSNDLRIEVATALGEIGPPANAALASLSRMVDNTNPDVRQAASAALVKIAPGGKGLGPALVAAVLNRDRVCVESLASTLQRSGEVRTSVVRLTDLAANDPDTIVRASAHRAVELLSRR